MLECHHIVFRSKKGLDFELNYKYLTIEEHHGSNGPHKNREIDLIYKIEMQQKLEKLLTQNYYNVKQLIDLLGLKEKQANRAFRKLMKVNGISRKDVIFRLMGNRFYSWEELNSREEIVEFIRKNYMDKEGNIK